MGKICVPAWTDRQASMMEVEDVGQGWGSVAGIQQGMLDQSVLLRPAQDRWARDWWTPAFPECPLCHGFVFCPILVTSLVPVSP